MHESCAYSWGWFLNKNPGQRPGVLIVTIIWQFCSQMFAVRFNTRTSCACGELSSSRRRSKLWLSTCRKGVYWNTWGRGDANTSPKPTRSNLPCKSTDSVLTKNINHELTNCRPCFDEIDFVKILTIVYHRSTVQAKTNLCHDILWLLAE